CQKLFSSRDGWIEENVFKELEKRHGEVLDFTEKLVDFLQEYKKTGCERLKYPDLVAIKEPIDPILAWRREVKVSANVAYDFMWSKASFGSATRASLDDQGVPEILISTSSYSEA
ncbi:hypothetical protein KI387_006665, partial [Taxus chinensis]